MGQSELYFVPFPHLIFTKFSTKLKVDMSIYKVGRWWRCEQRLLDKLKATNISAIYSEKEETNER